MTLIAAYHINNQPFLLGDLLITNPRSTTERPVEIPTMRAEAEGIGHHPILDPLQKLSVITPYLAIGWAGGRQRGIEFIDNLRADVKSKRITWEEVKAHCRAVKLRNTPDDELAIVGWFALKDGHCKLFSVGGIDVKASAADFLVMAGTGADDDFVEAFNQAILLHRSLDTYYENLDPKMHWMILAGGLHAHEAYERHNSTTILKRFGGGYEGICMTKTGFAKTDNFTIAVWEIEVALEAVGQKYAVMGPFHACKMLYRRDALIMRVFNIKGKDIAGNEFETRNTAMAVQACYSSSHPSDIHDFANISFNSQAVLCVFYVWVNGCRSPESIAYPDIGKYEENKGADVEFVIEDNRVLANFSPQMQSQIEYDVNRIIDEYKRVHIRT